MTERLRALVPVVVIGLVLSGCSGRPAPEPRNEAAEIEPTQAEPTMTYGTCSRGPGECRDWVIVDRAFSGSDDADLVGFADKLRPAHRPSV